MATCMAVEMSGPACSSAECSGEARRPPPCIDLMATSDVSGPAVFFQIGTPTADEGVCHFIGTPTKQGVKLKDEDVDECFECDDSDDDCSRASDDDSDYESESEPEAPRQENSITPGKQLSWDDVADRNSRVRTMSLTVAEQQEPNWKLEAACHLAGRKGYAAGLDADRFDDSSDDDSDDGYMGCRCDNLDDDFEIGSVGSGSDDEL